MFYTGVLVLELPKEFPCADEVLMFEEHIRRWNFHWRRWGWGWGWEDERRGLHAFLVHELETPFQWLDRRCILPDVTRVVVGRDNDLLGSDHHLSTLDLRRERVVVRPDLEVVPLLHVVLVEVFDDDNFFAVVAIPPVGRRILDVRIRMPGTRVAGLARTGWAVDPFVVERLDHGWALVVRSKFLLLHEP
nr:hypothetical protein [Cressdnaviricota sp.]